MSDPYKRFSLEDLTLRDELAVDRTLMANERTLLVYLSTGVSLILAGMSFIHFAQSSWDAAIGASCIPMGFFLMPFGVVRYRKKLSTINALRDQFLHKDDETEKPDC